MPLSLRQATFDRIIIKFGERIETEGDIGDWE